MCGIIYYNNIYVLFENRKGHFRGAVGIFNADSNGGNGMYTKYSVSELSRIFSSPRSVYFIGIGGISMSSLAHIAHDRGCRVGGYDRTPSSLTSSLESCGIEIFYDIDPKHIDSYDVIVYTAAINSEQPELAAALAADERGEKFCVYRADFLGWLMSGSENRIGVSGMHGKSSTTSMISHIFLEADRDPTIVSGAELSELGGAYRLGSRRDFIMEACEYQDSFLSFTPNIAVVLNIDLDHTDYFSGIEQIIESFGSYLSIAKDGYAVVNAEDENVKRAISGYTGRLVTFGRGGDFTAENITFSLGCPEFDIMKEGSFFTHTRLKVVGEHHIMNALAAAAVSDICKIAPEQIARGLESFGGAKRRMELRGCMRSNSGDLIPVFDDYAHHPSEIKSTLSGALKMGNKRVFTVFQPHTYSRTASLFDEFAASFAGVNAVFADIYAARETNIYGVSSEKLAKAAGGLYLPTLDAIASYLKSELRAGDLLIVMGAGDIIKLDELILEK